CHAAEHRFAFQDQALQPGGIGSGLLGLVGERAEDTGALRNDLPVQRHPDLHAAEDGADLNDRLIARHSCLPEIEFSAAENGRKVGAAKVALANLSLEAAENGVRLEYALLIRRHVAVCPCPRTRKPVEQHENAYPYDDDQPSP